MIPCGSIDWWGLLGLVGLWLLVFGNDLVDVLLAWRRPTEAK